jgi:hypothetical protein
VVWTEAELAAVPCGFFLAASTDEIESTKAMVRNETNLAIISLMKNIVSARGTELFHHRVSKSILARVQEAHRR